MYEDPCLGEVDFTETSPNIGIGRGGLEEIWGWTAHLSKTTNRVGAGCGVRRHGDHVQTSLFRVRQFADYSPNSCRVKISPPVSDPRLGT